MTDTALITGASAGLGQEFARYHASKGGDVILVARRRDAMETLKQELEDKQNVNAHVIDMDLGAAGAPTELYRAVKELGVDVGILINNAGFGGHGDHLDRDLDQEMAMIDLNVSAVVSLTHLFAKDMVARGKGRILNVGSTAGFMPGPKQAVYFATKAFVNSFSQAIDQELRDKGVTCTVLAPGYVETEFAKVADLEGTNLVKSGATAKSVAKLGYDAMRMGQLVAINEARLNFLLNWVVPLMPRRAVLKMVSAMQAK